MRFAFFKSFFVLFLTLAFSTNSYSSTAWLIGKWVAEDKSSLEFLDDSRVLSYIPDQLGLGSSSVIGEYKIIDKKRLLITWDRPSDRDVIFDYKFIDRGMLLLEVPKYSYQVVYRRDKK